MTQRTPLTSEQHILHLLISVFTAGLWVPIWIIRSVQGNRRLLPPDCHRCGLPAARHVREGADLMCPAL